MKKVVFLALMSIGSASAVAEPINVKMTDLTSGKNVGSIMVDDSQYGAVFTPSLTGIPAGMHGFHIHENASCDPKIIAEKKVIGGAAGGHFDPKKTGKHGFPWTNDNHLGDLPALSISAEGKGTYPVLAPRIKLADLQGRAVMIHVGGDNYSDHPHQLGGGGARLICGVVESPAMKKVKK